MAWNSSCCGIVFQAKRHISAGNGGTVSYHRVRMLGFALKLTYFVEEPEPACSCGRSMRTYTKASRKRSTPRKAPPKRCGAG